jgi:hypothetical protein
MLGGDPVPSFPQHLVESKTALSGEPGLANRWRCQVIALKNNAGIIQKQTLN